MRTSTSRPAPLPRILALLPIALGACGEPPPALQVGGASFTEDQLLGLSPTRRATLVNLTAVGLAVADSSFLELGAPLVERWTEDRLLEILAAELVLEKHGVGDDVLEARYLTDPAWELTVRHVLFFSERWRTATERDAAREKADRALEQLRGGADFAETAAALSEEPGAVGRQGLLTPGREGSWVPEFWAAALALQPGEMSPVTETQYGFHILRLEDRQVVPFAQARSRLARQVADRLEDPQAVLEAWLDGQAPEATAEARRQAALDEARRRGLTVPDAEVAALVRRWDDQVYRWSAALGFSYGASDATVAQAALDALARTAQGAVIARDEVDAHAWLVHARHPETAPPSAP